MKKVDADAEKNDDDDDASFATEPASVSSFSRDGDGVPEMVTEKGAVDDDAEAAVWVGGGDGVADGDAPRDNVAVGVPVPVPDDV